MLYPLLILAAGLAPIGDAPAFRQPRLAVSGKLTGMTFGAGQAIYYAGSTDGGRTFGAPVKVASTGALALGRHRGPRLAITGKAMVISAISGAGRAVDLETWRSADGGRTWAPGGRVNDVPASAREGLHAMTALPDGSVYALWLDMREKGMRLYGAASKDGGLTWGRNALVYASPGGTICECCHPSLAVELAGGQPRHVCRQFHRWRDLLPGGQAG